MILSKHYLPLIYSIFVLSILVSCSKVITNREYTEGMKLELKNMYNDDQQAQKYDLKKVVRKEYSDSMETEFNILCDKHIFTVKKYFVEYGFPGIKENGNETALNFWLIVQHGDNHLDFQQNVLKAMKKQLTLKNVSSRNYAYLYDRVKKNQNKPQLYGTQMVWDSKGSHFLYKIKSPKRVNERRKKMGLEPLEDYKNNFND